MCGGFVQNFKFRSFLFLATFLAVTAVVAPHKAFAQDDMPNDDESSIAPPSTTNGAPPVIIDESDSGAVSDVEEYDG